MGHTHTAIAGHVRAAHALRRIAAAHHRKASRELVLAARASTRCTRAIARYARLPALDPCEPSLAARLPFPHASLRSSHEAAVCELTLAAREQSTLCVALVARELALAAREAVRAVAQHACCPHATARALLSPLPTRPFLTAHDTRQGCCLVLVHHALARCIRTAWATSSLARRRMPALYNTP